MKNIRLIASDLDGTLLNSQHCLTERVKTMWKKLKDMGIHFMPVTGRTLSGMRSSIDYSLCEYSINTNGVHIFLNEEGIPKQIWNKSMPWEDAYEILEVGVKEFSHVGVQAYVGEKLYSIEENERTAEYSSRSGIHYEILKDWREIEGSKIAKIMFLHDNEILQPLEEKLQKSNRVQGVFSMPMYLEVFSSEASKGHALRHVMKLLDIDVSETLGIGDSFNDLALLEVCGTSYVMKNANEKVAPHLPRTEYTNNEDGVVRLIESLISL